MRFGLNLEQYRELNEDVKKDVMDWLWHNTEKDHNYPINEIELMNEAGTSALITPCTGCDCVEHNHSRPVVPNPLYNLFSILEADRPFPKDAVKVLP
jgi:hypothetical protein